MICQEIMTREMIVISPQTKGREILRLLAEDPGRPLIVANEAGFLLGVVTARDFLRLHLDWVKNGPFLDPMADDEALSNSARRLSELSAQEIMVPAAIVAQVDTAVNSVIVPMVQQSLNFVPVVREGRIEGVIGRAEILRVMAKMLPPT
ncbi:MAG: CBS domain-containing protein [Firmicutes bacterium]|nr:CBS domain-containing protein [Bacillota bacterium]